MPEKLPDIVARVSEVSSNVTSTMTSRWMARQAFRELGDEVLFPETEASLLAGANVEELHEGIQQMAAGLTAQDARMAYGQHTAVYRRVNATIQPDERLFLRGASQVFGLPDHTETVRALFTALDHPQAEQIGAYRYARVVRVQPLQPVQLPPEMRDANLEEEYYLVGLDAVHTDEYKKAVIGIVSLAPHALELLSLADVTLRQEPATPLPESRLSASARVYELLRADSESQAA